MRVARRRTTPEAVRRRGSTAIAPLVLALALPLAAAGAASASGAPPKAVPAAADSGSQDQAVQTTYSNPLTPDVPRGGTVDSCADPMVLRGQEEGATTWYMYCTTDPLNDDDRNAEGGLVFNRVPQLVSTDLVKWVYVGNALSAETVIPAWVDPTASFWAPDVVYNSKQDRYYLFVTVTETMAAGGVSDTCRGDSAIGVATSDSPLGPWTFADEPVVAPRVDPNSDATLECRPYLWTYDPSGGPSTTPSTRRTPSFPRRSILRSRTGSGSPSARRCSTRSTGSTAGRR
jgi:arabinan endo-1,5-alpha-L-arabinosidase